MPKINCSVRKSELQKSEGLILIIAGVLVFVFGVYFFLYSEWNWIWGTQYPYRTMGVGLMVVGFIVLAWGIQVISKASPLRQRAEMPKPPE